MSEQASKQSEKLKVFFKTIDFSKKDTIREQLTTMIDVFTTAIYQIGYEDGLAAAASKPADIQDTLAAAAEAAAADIDKIKNAPPSTAAVPESTDEPPANDSPGTPAGSIDKSKNAITAAAPQARDPLSYRHAKSGEPVTLCGVPIDHRIDAIDVQNDGRAQVTCPDCLTRLQGPIEN